jgi:membrane protein YdbS with pleckstrin-like domain
MSHVSENEQNEKMGRAVVGIAWIIFAAKFIIIATVVALVILYFIGKPLWIAPIAAVIVFAAYRILWGSIWRLISRLTMR